MGTEGTRFTLGSPGAPGLCPVLVPALWQGTGCSVRALHTPHTQQQALLGVSELGSSSCTIPSWAVRAVPVLWAHLQCCPFSWRWKGFLLAFFPGNSRVAEAGGQRGRIPVLWLCPREAGAAGTGQCVCCAPAGAHEGHRTCLPHLLCSGCIY